MKDSYFKTIEISTITFVGTPVSGDRIDSYTLEGVIEQTKQYQEAGIDPRIHKVPTYIYVILGMPSRRILWTSTQGEIGGKHE